MNNKAQLFFFTLMLAVVVIILALALTPVIRESVDNVRNTTTMDGAPGLDCGNESILDQNKATCIITDLSSPYFFGILLGIAGAAIGARVILG